MHKASVNHSKHDMPLSNCGNFVRQLLTIMLKKTIGKGENAGKPGCSPLYIPFILLCAYALYLEMSKVLSLVKKQKSQRTNKLRDELILG